jgi:hypothetical protein
MTHNLTNKIIINLIPKILHKTHPHNFHNKTIINYKKYQKCKSLKYPNSKCLKLNKSNNLLSITSITKIKKKELPNNKNTKKYNPNFKLFEKKSVK